MRVAQGNTKLPQTCTNNDIRDCIQTVYDSVIIMFTVQAFINTLIKLECIIETY